MISRAGEKIKYIGLTVNKRETNPREHTEATAGCEAGKASPAKMKQAGATTTEKDKQI